MNLEPNKVKKLTQVAIEAAQKSGELIESYKTSKISKQEKDTGTSLASKIVTEVDLLSQKTILEFIQPTLKEYDLGLLAEESMDDGSRFQKHYFWCIDPLDGTLPFTEGRPGYAVSIALLSQAGEPLIGVIYNPQLKTLYHAIKGMGAFKNNEPWDITHQEPSNHEVIEQGGAVMNACLALENAPACFYKNPKTEQGGGCSWDYAATTCLYKELGAWVSDMRGNPLDLNPEKSLFMNEKGVLFATHESIAKKILSK